MPTVDLETGKQWIQFQAAEGSSLLHCARVQRETFLRYGAGNDRCLANIASVVCACLGRLQLSPRSKIFYTSSIVERLGHDYRCTAQAFCFF
jgi:hypothetical protein